MQLLVAVLTGLALSWAVLVIALLLGKPKGALLEESIRLLPDTLKLLKNLATDASLPRGIRARLWGLFAYLAVPFDLVPDFIPIIGYADDAIVVAIVLRSVVRRAGIDAVRRHWSGTENGFATLTRIAGLMDVKR